VPAAPVNPDTVPRQLTADANLLSVPAGPVGPAGPVAPVAPVAPVEDVETEEPLTSERREIPSSQPHPITNKLKVSIKLHFISNALLNNWL
jgi:hypothetical protein